MSKIILILLLVTSTGLGSNETFLDQHKKKIDKELEKWCEGISQLESIKTRDNREFYRIINSDNQNSGILVLSSAKGRFDNFDLMTIVVSNKIDLIRILKYRSEYGSEISNKKWLAQFYNKPDEQFVFRKNIDAISGATFSAQGIVNEANDILKALGNIDK